MSLQHRRFVCKDCGRQITGCPPSCEGDHTIEKVESCAFCAKLPADQRHQTETFPSRSMEKRVKMMRAARKESSDPVAQTDVAEQTALKKLASGELW